MPAILLAAAHKQAHVRTAAEEAIRAFSTKMSINAVPLVLKDRFAASEVGVAWQTRTLALSKKDYYCSTLVLLSGIIHPLCIPAIA